MLRPWASSSLAATNGATSRRRFCACRGSAALRKSCSSGVIPPTLRNASASRRLQGCCPEAGQGQRRPRRASSKSRRLPARMKKRGDSVHCRIFRDESQNLGRLLKNSSILADASGRPKSMAVGSQKPACFCFFDCYQTLNFQEVAPIERGICATIAQKNTSRACFGAVSH